MPFFTPTGKPERSDLAPKRSLVGDFYRTLLWRSNFAGFARLSGLSRFPWFNPVRAAPDTALVDDRTPEERVPWHGLDEAELTEDKEHEAQHEASRTWHHDDHEPR